MAEKPRKPWPSFPLTPHVRGGWAKHYKGHQLYIPDREHQAALKAFHRLAKLIDDGRWQPKHRKPIECVTVYDVCNRYVFERQQDVDGGRLSQGACDDYDASASEMIECFGTDTRYEDLAPDDFTHLFRLLDKRLGAHALARSVQTCRTIWNHAYQNEWIKIMPRFGTQFRKPTADKKTGIGFLIEEYRTLVACAVGNVQVEAMLLLMVNGGYGAKDCAALPRSAVDFNLNIIRFPRPKMRRRRPVDRVMVMWPETAEALRQVMVLRPDDDLVFRTIHGNPWVQGNTDSVCLMVQRIVKDLGWKLRGPSWLRHLHRTITDELEKPHAAARLMGHRIAGIADVYIDHIEHSRIQQITDHLRQRVWPDAAAAVQQHPAPSETARSVA